MRSAGMEIEILLKYVNLFKKGSSTLKERKNLLEEQKQKLLKKQKDINETLERLNYKIELYDEIEAGKRKDFAEEIYFYKYKIVLYYVKYRKWRF